MLGDKIGEFTGKSTGQRVLPGDDYRYVKMEITWEAQGTLCGVPGQDIGTVTIWERVPGQVYATGQCIFMGEAGGTIWNGMSVQRMSGEGMGGSIRSVSAYQAPAEGPLSRLNGVLVLAETEMGADGTVKSTLWEWK